MRSRIRIWIWIPSLAIMEYVILGDLLAFLIQSSNSKLLCNKTELKRNIDCYYYYKKLMCVLMILGQSGAYHGSNGAT